MPVVERHRGHHGVGHDHARLRVARGIALLLFGLLLVAPHWQSPAGSLAQEATPVATQPARQSTATKSAVWDQVDVTVELRDDGSFHVTERSRVAFSGGPYRTGYREIPLARIEEIDNIR